MVHLVWLIGAVIAVWGLTAVFKPEWMKAFVQKLSVNRRYLLASMLRLLFGVIFLILGRNTQMPRVVLFLGLLFLAGGILLLVLPAAKVHALLNWWNAKPVWVYRLWGVAAVVFGAFVIYAGWPAAL